jgi:hypothetical protein
MAIKVKIPVIEEITEITSRSMVLEESRTDVSRNRKLIQETEPIPREAKNILKK